MSSVMLEDGDFKSRYAAALDVTMESALSETRSLYESIVEELQEEMSSVKKENEALRSKYNRLMEQRRIHTASQCDFLPQVPEEQDHLQKPEKKTETESTVVEPEKKTESTLVEPEKTTESTVVEKRRVDSVEKTTGSTLTIVSLKSTDDNGNREMARLEYVITHTDKVVCRAPRQSSDDDRLVSSNSSETDSVDSDESEDSQDTSDEDSNAPKPQAPRSAKGRLSVRNRRYVEASKQTAINKRTPRVKCTICKKICHNAAGLKIHMRIHVLAKSYACTVCGQGWYRKGNLTKHMKQKHMDRKPDTVDRPFSCTVCHTNFKLIAHLKRHMTIHTIVKAYMCEVCGKRYKYKAGLDMHLRTHKEAKLFTCTVCGKGFRSSKCLTSHTRIHTGEKPCVCTVCGRSFCNSKSLSRHMIVHTGKKCFSCVICRKRFYQSAELKEHMAIHTITDKDERHFSQHVDTYDHTYAMAFPC